MRDILLPFRRTEPSGVLPPSSTPPEEHTTERVRHTSFVLISDCTRPIIDFPEHGSPLCAGRVRNINRRDQSDQFSKQRAGQVNERSHVWNLLRSGGNTPSSLRARMLENRRVTSALIFGKPRMFRIPPYIRWGIGRK